MAHLRVLKRENGTRQVQIVWGKVAGRRKVEYVGSSRVDAEIDLLLFEARERINAGQGSRDLGIDGERHQPVDMPTFQTADPHTTSGNTPHIGIVPKWLCVLEVGVVAVG
ncbi:MAG: hypothetical protein FWD59_10180 [Micrococcales bacterium]|nr:hypothetical protein [Micrococcales bacterium]